MEEESRRHPYGLPFCRRHCLNYKDRRLKKKKIVNLATYVFGTSRQIFMKIGEFYKIIKKC
jgi:hypothetical protein